MLDLLYILNNRDNYNKYKSFIKDNIVSDDISLIIKDMGVWFDTKACPIDWISFSTWFCFIKHPTFKDEKLDRYRIIFGNMYEYEPEEELTEGLIETLVQRDYATQVYFAAQDVADGKSGADLDDVATLMERYHAEVGHVAGVTQHVLDWDIHDIVDSTVGSGGLNWRLNCLNESIGQLRKGNFVIIGARPDTGKTTMIASEATHMAIQLPEDEHVLWFNNEEAGKTVQSRIIQSALGVTAMDIATDPAGAWEAYVALMGRGDKIKLIDKANMSVKDIRETLDNYKAGLIVFDQLWKVSVGKSDNDVHAMTKIFNMGREWAKEHAPVITVHQADATAEGQEYLTMNQLYMSKTGVQGEADAIIMIGRSHDTVKQDSRFIHVPKNKFPSSATMNPKSRNIKAEVEILTDIGRFKD